jgi:UTP--glucose-1-phosphate uridylyltransferase
MCRSQAFFAYHCQGKRYDIGDKLGFIQATIDFALQRLDFKEEVLAYLKDMMARYKE